MIILLRGDKIAITYKNNRGYDTRLGFVDFVAGDFVYCSPDWGSEQEDFLHNGQGRIDLRKIGKTKYGVISICRV